MTISNRRALLLIALSFVFIFGCHVKDISNIARIGEKFSDSLLLESRQIIPYKDGFFVVHDIAKETGNIQMFILILDSQNMVRSTVPFPSLKIDSIFNDTIFSEKSVHVREPFFASGVSVPTQFIFKYTDSETITTAGFNVANKLVNRVSYDRFTNKLWFYFFKSDSLHIGVATNKEDYIDSSFIRQFTKIRQFICCAS